jgi:hypothetical protein
MLRRCRVELSDEHNILTLMYSIPTLYSGITDTDNLIAINLLIYSIPTYWCIQYQDHNLSLSLPSQPQIYTIQLYTILFNSESLFVHGINIDCITRQLY